MGNEPNSRAFIPLRVGLTRVLCEPRQAGDFGGPKPRETWDLQSPEPRETWDLRRFGEVCSESSKGGFGVLGGGRILTPSPPSKRAHRARSRRGKGNWR